MRKTCLDMVHRLALNDPRIFFIGSDLGHGTLDVFKGDMPDRFFMEGVSEANILGMAAGLALEGKIVYVNTIASFLTRRCFEQVVIDLCLHQVKVRLIGNGGGLVYAPLGPTHTTVEDIAIMRALPGMAILAPADAREMEEMMPMTVNHPGPLYIRLAKGGDPLVTRSHGAQPMDRAFTYREGTDVLIITTGITLRIADQAAKQLSAEGLEAAVLHVPTIKPLDSGTILAAAEKVSAVVTIEEHSIIGGIGSAVAELLFESGLCSGKKFKRLGIPDIFPDAYGSQASLLERYGITVEGLCQAVRDLCGN